MLLGLVGLFQQSCTSSGVWNHELQSARAPCARQSRNKCVIWCERSIKSCLPWTPEARKIGFQPDGEQQIMLNGPPARCRHHFKHPIVVTQLGEQKPLISF